MTLTYACMFVQVGRGPMEGVTLPVALWEETCQWPYGRATLPSGQVGGMLPCQGPWGVLPLDPMEEVTLPWDLWEGVYLARGPV